MSRLNRLFYVAALGVGAVGVLTALWPTSLAGPCPWLHRHSPSWRYVNRFLSMTGYPWGGVGSGDATYDPGSGLKWYTRDELKAYDGSDPAKPILLAIGGDV